MRNIISVSLPGETVREIKREARESGFISTSEFIRHVWRERQAQKLADELKRDRREFERGKGKVLRTLQDLY